MVDGPTPGMELARHEQALVESLIDPLEQIIGQGGLVYFAQTCLDQIAQDVIEWMPAQDNEAHHNAVEKLRRAFETSKHIEVIVADHLEIPRTHRRRRADFYGNEIRRAHERSLRGDTHPTEG